MNVKKCVRALLCLYLTLIIAMDAVKAQALKVGDTLPPDLWSMPLQVINHPEGKETLTLSEYKDKLIILEFRATWCAPCIKSLTKLDTLQKEFGEQLAVETVTYKWPMPLICPPLLYRRAGNGAVKMEFGVIPGDFKRIQEGIRTGAKQHARFTAGAEAFDDQAVFGADGVYFSPFYEEVGVDVFEEDNGAVRELRAQAIAGEDGSKIHALHRVGYLFISGSMLAEVGMVYFKKPGG